MLCLLAGIAYGSDPVQPLTLTEYEVQAAFLYNFAKFVEWPPEVLKSSGDTFTLCVTGADPFGNDLDDELSGKMVRDKKLALKRIMQSKDISTCQVLFVSASEDNRLGALLSKINGLPVLTVSDMDRFIDRGGMIGFSMDDNRVRFSVNLAAADKAGLKISSQVLKLAKAVQS